MKLISNAFSEALWPAV